MSMQPQIRQAAARSLGGTASFEGLCASLTCRESCPSGLTLSKRRSPLNLSFRLSGPLRQNRSVTHSARQLSPEESSPYLQRQLDDAIGDQKEKQARTPWHREGSDLPPVKRPRSAGAMTKGKLLTTPSRLLKLIVPLTTADKNSDRKDIEPLALLVHPQQPLSYLERLIQSELPTIKDAQGKEKIPSVFFRAEDSAQDSLMPQRKQSADQPGDLEEGVEEDDIRGGPGEGGVETYSGLGHEIAGKQGQKERHFVRWSSSTEVGDFIRDAARGEAFDIEIEGIPENIRVGVPSFNDRTHYLRLRLRKTSRKIADLATIKHECDVAAHKGGQRVAMGGFGLMLTWWSVVYWCTFETNLTWDVMEPVTYLVGMGTVMGGYLWFLYHNREASYRSAMNLTVSRRQTKLYQTRNFDLQKWEALIEEGNNLRREIKAVAEEYDVEWDEKADEGDENVTEALKESRVKSKSSDKGQDKGKEKRDQNDDEDD
ncbi:MAG: CAAX farnesyltransferase (FTase) subunit beta [Chaenotheca gracillima]|nr:MAG: CAAX farnesyltransferase (FTase) subunit beta [Chaenotheca gracillima]